MGNLYAIRRHSDGLFYGPVWGAFYPDWTPLVENALLHTNKRAAIAEARSLKLYSGADVVQVGDFGGVANRIIATVATI